MRRITFLALTIVAAGLPAGAADLVPHEARYSIALGTAVNATQVGTARQLLTEACRLWQIERDIDIRFNLTTTWRFDVKSSLQGRQGRDGGRFDYTLSRNYNGEASQRSGTILPAIGTVGRADLRTPTGAQHLTLPPRTFLPASGLRHIIDALQAGRSEFAFKMWDSEIISDVFSVSVNVLADDAIARPRPIEGGAELLNGRAWPIYLVFRRARDGDGVAPLFSATMLLHENGVIARMTVPLGLVTLAVEPISFMTLARVRC